MRLTNNQFIKTIQILFLMSIIALGLIIIIASGGGDGNEETDDNDGTDDNTLPTAAITGPIDGSIHTFGDTVTFTGSGDDEEDGALSESSLVWSSAIDGQIGTGTSLTRDDLSLGDHTITLTAIDNEGSEGSDEVNISVKSWTHPADLNDYISPDGRDVDWYPQVAMDNSGNAIITWQGKYEHYHHIFMSEYRNGAWTHPVDLNDYISPGDGLNAMYPQVAMDNSGNAIITWHQLDDSDDRIFRIFMSEYRNGAWTHPVDLDDYISLDDGDAMYPQVAMDNSGNAIITWIQSDGSNSQVFMSEYRNGAWTHPVDLDDNISPNDGDAILPQAAMDNSGNAIITWIQSDGSNKQIFMSEYRNGAWRHPVDLHDNISPDGQDAFSIYYSLPTRVAMDDNGNAIITWFQSDGSKLNIFMSEYRNGAWTHPVDSNDYINPDGRDLAMYPQVAMDNSGNAIITWFQSDNNDDDDDDDCQIFMSEYRNGAWTHPVDLDDSISSDGQDVDWYPQVAMDNRGNAIIAWCRSDLTYTHVFMSEYRNGAWTHPVDFNDYINPDGQDVAIHPQVAMDDRGNAIITWHQSDGSNTQVFMSEYR